VNTSPSRPYIGRFAPSPTGPLHAGSLVAALASYLDARANGGAWLIRIEDIDEGRAVPGAADTILEQLAWLGMHSDGEIVWQSRRKALYQAARERLADTSTAAAATAGRSPIRAWASGRTARPSTPAPAATAWRRDARRAACACGCRSRAPIPSPSPTALPARSASGWRWNPGISCSNAPTATGPTSWPWWWTMRRRA
jgi:glutamyl/glutaminyl-tRNA synthetase